MSVRVVPEVVLTVHDSPWPHEPGRLPGESAVSDFTVEREITSGTLPGQVRAPSGFSIGSGSATVAQSFTDRPFTPYSASRDRRVEAGQPARLEAIFDDGTIEPLGAWKVTKASGSLAAPSIQIPLSESVYGTGRAVLGRPAWPLVDAAWVVDYLARQAGYYATPKPSPGVSLSVPGIGGLHAERGRITVTGKPTFTQSLGQASVASGKFTARLPFFSSDDGLEVVYLTVTAAVFEFRLGNVRIVVEHGTFTVYGTTTGSATFARASDPNHPLRFQLMISQLGSTVSVRARSQHDAGWSTTVTVTGYASGDFRYISGAFNGLQISPIADFDAWAAPSASIDLLGSQVARPYIESGVTVWQGIQKTVHDLAAAAWLSRHGVLQVKSRISLTGSGQTPTTLDVSRSVEDLAWNVASDDFADRLTCTYHPLTPPEFPDDVEEWPATPSTAVVGAGRTAAFVVDLGGYVDTVYQFVHAEVAAGDESTWEANTASDGSGAELRTGITVAIESLSPSALIVRIRNATLFDAYFVDYDGAPALTVRGSGVHRPQATALIAYGVDEADAKNELAIDLGPLVQDEATAREIAEFLWSRASVARWRAESIRIPFDLSLDIGQLVRLVHAPTGLDASALITRISLAGSTGKIDMVIDLILLPPTYEMYDATHAGRTYADLDALYANTRYADLEANPLGA